MAEFVRTSKLATHSLGRKFGKVQQHEEREELLFYCLFKKARRSKN
jgi:hypothetical protein